VTYSYRLADGCRPPDHSLRRVLEVTAPIGPAFIALGMALGLLIVHAGLAWWWAPVFAAVLYAGSLAFSMVGLAVTAAPVATVAPTSIIVNSRHLFYALSFPLDRVTGRWTKLYSTCTLSDEACVIAVSPEAKTWTTRPLLIMQLSLDFALTALFIVLAIDAHNSDPTG
jgi:4-azaleucine resistance transporter AzlC